MALLEKRVGEKVQAMLGIRARALLWMFLAAGLIIVCLQQFSGPLPIQTNILALLPPTERNPVAEKAVEHLSEMIGNRVFFLVGKRSEQNIDFAGAAAKSLAEKLKASGELRQVVAVIPPFDVKELTRFYHPYRFNLLSDDDRIRFQTAKPDLEARLHQKLYSPFRFGLTLPLSEDPLGLTDNWLAEFPFKNFKLQPENGFLTAREEHTVWVMVSAALPESAYDHEVQGRVAAAVTAAEKALSEEFQGVEILRTGTLFYADAARQNAERDVNMIATGSLIGLMLLLYLGFRSVRPLVLGLLSVGFGILAAIVVTVAVYGEMHLITLVFGASLIGEAIDYAIQYFAAHLGAGSDWEPMAGLRRVSPALTVALATSLLCYGALMLTPFSALSQIALFALTGLSCAWVSVFLLLPWLLKKPSHRDPAKVARLPRKFLWWWQEKVGRRSCYMLLLFVVVASFPGWLKLSGNDDIRLLIAKPQTLVKQEEKIRALTGFGNDSQFYLIEGETPEVVLSREEKLVSRLKTLIEEKAVHAFQSVSTFVPSMERQQENRALWGKNVFADRERLVQLFAEADLRDEIAGQLFNEFTHADHQWITVEEWMKQPVSAPFRHLWLGSMGKGHASVVLLQGVGDISRLEEIAEGIPGITFVDKPGSVSRLFQKYRSWGVLWFLGALALVYGVLCVRYGVRQAVFVLLPTLMAIMLTLGIFGFRATPLTLFNLMGFMLVLGVGVNYSIFLREGGIKTGAPLAGVLLSAGTTLLSFGLLTFSSMLALSNFGLTLLLGISLSVLFSPMVLTFAREKNA